MTDHFRGLDGPIRLAFNIALDEDRYLDRNCPSVECGFQFKVLFEDWDSKIRDEQAYCPFCRHHAPIVEYNTPEQQEYIRQVALAEVQKRLGVAMRSYAGDFNRSQRPTGGLLSISLRMDVRMAPEIVAVPAAAAEAMRTRIVCESCGCRFSVIGAAYFCPTCGYNSAGQVFDQSIAAARATVGALPQTRSALADPDLAAQVAKSLIENGLTSLVTAFQRFAEAEYSRLPNPAARVRRNAFQNLQEGDQLWVDAGGNSYGQHLDTTEQADLQRLFQQRHLLAHREGLVDAEYIQKSGDTAYTAGQRLVVREAAVLRLAELLEKLAAGMRRDLPA